MEKPILGVINGFEIIEFNEKLKERRKSIEVRYLMSGRYLASSKFINLSYDAVEKIRMELLDYTQYNYTIEQQCQALTLPTIIMQLEEIAKKDR